MPDAETILIVDDEVDILDLLDVNLSREGFGVVRAETGRGALDAMERHRPRLVILDLMLPDLSGTEVCRRIRANDEFKDTPVIMLTARGEEFDRVVGFEVGADDYVVKSNLSMRELVLRIRAVLRRRGMAVTSVRKQYGPLSIDETGHRVWVDDEEVMLTATEFRLLTELSRAIGKVQTRGSLLQRVWDMPADLNTRTVDTHVKRLREKLGAASERIETVRGVGYRFSRNAR
jgi:two-component system, OmpR family, phosphate regulon response regulator PhoB